MKLLKQLTFLGLLSLSVLTSYAQTSQGANHLSRGELSKRLMQLEEALPKGSRIVHTTRDEKYALIVSLKTAGKGTFASTPEGNRAKLKVDPILGSLGSADAALYSRHLETGETYKLTEIEDFCGLDTFLANPQGSILASSPDGYTYKFVYSIGSAVIEPYLIGRMDSKDEPITVTSRDACFPINSSWSSYYSYDESPDHHKTLADGQQYLTYIERDLSGKEIARTGLQLCQSNIGSHFGTREYLFIPAELADAPKDVITKTMLAHGRDAYQLFSSSKTDGPQEDRLKLPKIILSPLRIRIDSVTLLGDNTYMVYAEGGKIAWQSIYAPISEAELKKHPSGVYVLIETDLSKAKELGVDSSELYHAPQYQGVDILLSDVEVVYNPIARNETEY